MTTSSDGAKPAQVGLVDMGNILFYSPPYNQPTFTLSDLDGLTGLFSEMVLNVTWAQLQATEGGPLDTTVIDNAIREVTAYNDSHPGANLGIKLRVWGGYTAPDWAKRIDGPPLTILGQATVNPASESPQEIGRFWTADYIDAWTAFQKQLADRFDKLPLIRGISNTAGAAATDEPFVPLFSSPPTGPHVNQPGELVSGGYSDAAELLTLRASIADYAQWSTTPLDFTMNHFWENIFGDIADPGDPANQAPDKNVTLAVLQQARNSTRLVQPGNHALSNPLYSADSFLYAQMGADANLDPSTAPGSFQTNIPGLLINDPGNPDTYANWANVVTQGVRANAGNIELWDFPDHVGEDPGFTLAPPGLIQSLATLLASGIAPLTGAPGDGSALGFIAPAFVTGAPGTVAFSGTAAVLLASATRQNVYSITLTSLNGGALAVGNFNGFVTGAGGSTLSFAGSLPFVNTILANLTDTLPSGTDVVHIQATDSSGDIAVRDVGVRIVSPAPSSVAGNSIASGGGALGIAARLAASGISLVGGVQSASVIAGDLQIGGPGNNASLLAALAPSAYSTASLAIGGALAVHGGGSVHFTGALAAGAVTIDSGGTISGGGTLTAGGPIANNGAIEAAADLTLGLQRLTVVNALSGDGLLIVDPGASLTLGDAVGSGQVVQFARNSIAQFANDPYSPSTLVLEQPDGWQAGASIRGFSFADRLVLVGVSATSVDFTPFDPGDPDAGGTLTVFDSGDSWSFKISGALSGLTPAIVSHSASASTIAFVAPPAGVAPAVAAPATLEGAAGNAVFVPDIVVLAPLPATPPSSNPIYSVTLAAPGVFHARDDDGRTHVAGDGTAALTLTGTLGAVERSLQTLTYTATAAAGEQITIQVDGGPAATIDVHTGAPTEFDWQPSASILFGDAGNWTTGSGSQPAPPGGNNVAHFGAGADTVSGDGAVAEILVTGTTTLTGQVTAQGRGGLSLVVDSGGALTLAGGALLTAHVQATVGGSGQGLLTLMGGALALVDNFVPNSLVIGEQSGSTGTVVNLEQITAASTVVVGEAGTGALALLGVASTVLDGGAVIGQLAGGQGSATVNGGEWMTAGQLTVGDAGSGALLIDGMANGIAGQATAFSATIGARAGGQGVVTLEGGELLVADAEAASSILTVGAFGDGSLAVEDGSEVAVGVVQGSIASNNGRLVVGGGAGGSGRIRIGDNGALLVYGNALVGGAGAGAVTVGESPDDTALFALIGALGVGAGGQVTLGGAGATVRASDVDIAPGGVVSGAGTLSGDGGGNGMVTLARIDNDGTIAASGGNLLLYGGVSGTGTLSIAARATLTLQSVVGRGQTLAFSPDARAVLDDPRAFKGTITGFGAGDVLELASTQASSATWANGVLTIYTAFGAFQLEVTGSYGPNAFSVQSDGLGGTDVTAGGWGDVHMTTFDGLHYDLQSTGDFVAVRSTNRNPWQIQIRTASVPGATSITTELAAQLGDTRVTFAVGRDSTVYIDGVADTTLQNGGVQSFAGGSLARLSADTWRLSWNSGEQVTVSEHGVSLDWSVGLGSNGGRGSVQGLLGTDSGWARDFQLPNGSYLQPPINDGMLGSFADAWRVSPAASLFDDMSVPAMPAGALPLMPQPFSATALAFPTHAAVSDPTVTVSAAMASSGDTLLAPLAPTSPYDT